MGDHAITATVSIVLAILGVAIVALIVSSASTTTGVLKSGGNALTQAVCVALSPVTGGGCATNVTSTITFG
jgi:hypothetical protein